MKLNKNQIGRIIDLADANIGTYTVSQLKMYIKTALNVVNEGNYYMNDYDIQETYDMLKESMYIRGTKMYGRISHALKSELFEKAMDLKIHMKSISDFYVPDTEEANVELNDRARKTYEKVKERWGDEDFTEAEFNKVTEMFGYFGKDVLERDLDSDQIYAIYQETYNEYGERTANSLFDIMKYEYHYMKKNPKIFGGMTKEEFTETWSERVRDKIKGY